METLSLWGYNSQFSLSSLKEKLCGFKEILLISYSYHSELTSPQVPWQRPLSNNSSTAPNQSYYYFRFWTGFVYSTLVRRPVLKTQEDCDVKGACLHCWVVWTGLSYCLHVGLGQLLATHSSITAQRHQTNLTTISEFGQVLSIVRWSGALFLKLRRTVMLRGPSSMAEWCGQACHIVYMWAWASCGDSFFNNSTKTPNQSYS